jgi:predicted secreted protein
LKEEKNMRRLMGFCVFILLTASSVQAQQKKLKVLISADMEGIGGVSTWEVQADSKGGNTRSSGGS